MNKLCTCCQRIFNELPQSYKKDEYLYYFECPCINTTLAIKREVVDQYYDQVAVNLVREWSKLLSE